MNRQSSEIAQQWDQVYESKFNTVWYPNEDVVRFCARLIQKNLSYDTYEVKRDVEHVLDLGCGNGRHVVFFAHQGFMVSGIDISAKAIEWAKDWCNREGLDADLRVADIKRLPFEDYSFDVVVSHGVLDHVTMEDARYSVGEVWRVLKPTGLFYCDLRSVEDFESGSGKQVAPNTFVIMDGFEEGLIQHFFTLDEVYALFDSLFRIIYFETNDHRLGPDFSRKYSRWIVATERL